ncbi:MAG: HVA1 family protein [Pseudomonadota bacterium]|nr:HVA1 family protein [Pseudomonadota bacterium]
MRKAALKREASKNDPTYLIEQDDSSKVLKSHSELKKSS